MLKLQQVKKNLDFILFIPKKVYICRMDSINNNKYQGTKYEGEDAGIASILHRENYRRAIVGCLQLPDLKKFDNYLIEKEIGKRKIN